MSASGGGSGQPHGWSRQGNAQMAQGGVTAGERLRSVTTTSGHTSGAHEVIPTNVQRGPTFQGLSPPVQLALSSARTDTARTVMSGSGGSAAGHTHSQQPTNGQPDAHDQNRGAFANWVSSHSGAAPTDEKEAAVMAGAIGVGSMAPAAVARSNGVDGGVRDQQAAASWEADREDAKAKVNGAFLTLPPAAQSRVTTTMQGFMSGVSGAPGTVTERALATDSALVLPTSPRRDTTTPSAPGFLKGGNYNGSPPQYVPPMGGTGAQMSANMTEPFRTEKSK